MSHTTIDDVSHVVSAAELPAAPAPGYWKSVGQRLARDPVTIIVTLMLLGILFITLGAPLVTNGDPYTGNVMGRLRPIGTPGHWLGTDETGRDLWTRICYGGRMSLLAAILPVTFALSIGGFLGILAGYTGGIVGTMIMRTMDVFYAFPSILLAIAICGMLGNGLTNAILALAVVFIPPMVRVSETLRISGHSYSVSAVRSGMWMTRRSSAVRPTIVLRLGTIFRSRRISFCFWVRPFSAARR